MTRAKSGQAGGKSNFPSFLLLAVCFVAAGAAPARGGSFASMIKGGKDEDAKGMSAVKGRHVGTFTADDALEVVQSERFDSVAAMVAGLFFENQAFEGPKTLAVLRAFASRKGMYEKAAVMAAWSPNVEAIVKALVDSRVPKDRELAAAILVVYAHGMSVDELDGGLTVHRTGGGKGNKGEVGGPIPELAIEPLVSTLLDDSSKEVQELALLSAGLARLKNLGGRVESLRVVSQPALEGARLFCLARLGSRLPAESLEAIFRARLPVDRRFEKLTPLMCNYELRADATRYACWAAGEAHDARFVAALLALTEHKDLRVQIDAIRALEGTGSPACVAPLVKKLQAKPPWPMAVAVLSALGGVPAKESVEPLIAFLGSETGRLRQDAAYALASIAGGLPEGNPYDWAGWWANHRDTFQVNPDATRKFRQKYRVQDIPVIPLADFYGIEIVSDHMVFVLDTSNSMRGEKIQKLKETMAFTVQGLPPDMRFNVVDFGGKVRVMKPGSLISAQFAAKAGELIADMSTTGGTRTFDAMEIATQLPEADTLVYLSDGAPVAGQFQDWGRIVRTFDVLTRYYPLAIHTIHYAAGGGKAGGSKDMQNFAFRNAGTSSVSDEATAKAQARAKALARQQAMRTPVARPTTQPVQSVRPAVFSDEAVEQAIRKGVEYLFSKQYGDGSWQPYNAGNNQSGGPTALVVYALLESGVSPQDPRILKALAWMEKHPSDMTYTLACRCNAWLAANRKTRGRFLSALRADSQMLVKGSYAGRHTYPSTDKAADKMWDNSNSQFGLLGVWAARQFDVEVPLQYWQEVRKHWQATQLSDSGWNYRGQEGPQTSTGTMTAGGVASLFVCFDELFAEEFVGCGKQMDDPQITKGLAWFDRNFAASLAAWASAEEGYYYLYGVERVGLAAGYKYFGTQDWYKLGTARLIGAQKDDGGWLGVHSNPANEIPDDGSENPAAKQPVSRPLHLSDTCFALLFLVRGRHPVLFNKLQYEGDWNNRPRDMASLTRWITNTFEKTVNWQIVNLNVPVRELHDAPILYIAGSKAPKFSPADLDKLREFVWQGGTLFSVTECDGQEFSKGIREVYRKLFGQYELVPVDKDHPIYAAHFPLRGTPPISVVSNGVRPLAVHTDVDLAKWWQLRAATTQRFAYETAANLFLYLTDYGSLRYRGTSLWPEGAEAAPTDRQVVVARLAHNGNADPEPLAYQRFALLMRQKARADVKLVGPIPPSALAASGAKVALLTGTNEFKLADADRQALNAFVDGGGTVVIDAAGGPRFVKDETLQVNRVAGFAASAEEMLRETFGEGCLRSISANAPVFKLPGMEIDRVRYRRQTRKRLGNSTSPSFRVVLAGERPAVFFSQEDLTASLVGYESAAVDGYAPDSAFQLLRNIVLYATPGAVPAATTPPAKPAPPKPGEP